MATATTRALGVDRGLIFDVGMHRGQDTRFYLDMGYRVVAVEADPALVKAARRAFAREIAGRQLQIVPCVVARQDGPVPFWVFPEKDEWNTANPRHAEQGAAVGHRCVPSHLPGRNFTSILNEYGIPYYLKIDIEGADLMCVDALSESSPPPRISHWSFQERATSPPLKSWRSSTPLATGSSRSSIKP